jgi:hypothetical protein
MQKVMISIVAEAWHVAKRYSLFHKNGNRSSKRTDQLNSAFINSVVRPIFSEDKGYKIKMEHSIACAYGGEFKMDIVVYKGDKIVAMFPLKAIEKSYNKNRFNFANTIVGEAYRIWGHPGISDREEALVAAVDWIPYKVPVGDKGKFETTKPANISSENLTKMATSFGYPNSKHISVKIRFDYDEATDEITNIDKKAVRDFMKELVEWEKKFE